MLLIGLTGSIATGKSTVSNILRSPPYSLPIIDADVLAREVVAPGTSGYAAIVSYFGPSTPDLLLEDPKLPKDQWPLNRPALGRRVFGMEEDKVRDRAKLNSIVHPAVRWGMYRKLASAYLSGARAVVLDVPLLFESGLDSLCGVVIVVSVTEPRIQMQRLMARDDHLTEDDAANRVRSQGDVREKAARCLARNGSGSLADVDNHPKCSSEKVGGPRGYVLYNDTSIEALEGQIQEVMGRIWGSSPRWWAWLLLLCPPLAGSAAALTYWRNKGLDERYKAGELERKARL